MTAGIGQMFSTGALSGLQGAGEFFAQAGMHGLAQGGMSLLDGGNFWQGFASGALGSMGAAAFGALVGQDFANKALGQIAFGALAGAIGAEAAGGEWWRGAIIGGMVAGLNHAMHNAGYNSDSEDPPYKYKGKEYDDKGSLYGAILVDKAAEQFGIKDIVALAAALDGTFPSIDKVGALGSGNKTSYASKYGSKLFPQKMGTKLPTHIKNGSLRYTKILGRFLGRIAGPIGWGLLAYDVGMTLYNTQTIYNGIINGK